MSDYSDFYYKRLTSAEKVVYEELKHHIEAFTVFPFKCECDSTESIERVIHFILMDCPELIQMPVLSSFRIATRDDGNARIYASEYACSQEEVNETLFQAERIAAKVACLKSGDEQQRRLIGAVLKDLHHTSCYWLKRNPNLSCDSPKGVLLDHTGICSAYSRTVTLILRDFLGLNAISVRCIIKPQYSITGKALPHMFNAIHTSTGWYFFDPVASMRQITGRNPIAAELGAGYFRKDYADGTFGEALTFYNAKTIEEKYEFWRGER